MDEEGHEADAEMIGCTDEVEAEMTCLKLWMNGWMQVKDAG